MIYKGMSSVQRYYQGDCCTAVPVTVGLCCHQELKGREEGAAGENL